MRQKDYLVQKTSGPHFTKELTTKLMNTYRSHTNQYFNFMALKYNYRILYSCKLLILFKYCSLKIVP